MKINPVQSLSYTGHLFDRKTQKRRQSGLLCRSSNPYKIGFWERKFSLKMPRNDPKRTLFLSVDGSREYGNIRKVPVNTNSSKAEIMDFFRRVKILKIRPVADKTKQDKNALPDTKNENPYEQNIKALLSIFDQENERPKSLKISAQKFDDDINDDFVIKKSFDTQGEESPENIEEFVRFGPYGETRKSRCETYVIDDDHILEKVYDKNNNLICELSVLSSSLDKDTIAEKKYIRDEEGHLQGIVVAERLGILCDFYEIKYYDAKDFQDEASFIDMVQKGQIEPFDLAKSYIEDDGVEVHEEEFSYDGYKTKRIFRNGSEWNDLLFQITNPQGEVYRLKRSFKMNGNNTTRTEVNGRIYNAIFDDDRKTIKINDFSPIDFDSKFYNMDSGLKDEIWELIKRAPADLLLNFYNVKKIAYDQFEGHIDFKSDGVLITTNGNLGMLAHELGHLRNKNHDFDEELFKREYIDNEEMKSFGGYNPFLQYNDLNSDFQFSDLTGESYYISDDEVSNAKQNNDRDSSLISKNPEVIDVYKEEMRKIRSKLSEPELENVKYYTYSDQDGLNEIVADVNALLSTKECMGAQTRLLYLLQYFPKTIAKIGEMMNFWDKKAF